MGVGGKRICKKAKGRGVKVWLDKIGVRENEKVLIGEASFL